MLYSTIDSILLTARVTMIRAISFSLNFTVIIIENYPSMELETSKFLVPTEAIFI